MPDSARTNLRHWHRCAVHAGHAQTQTDRRNGENRQRGSGDKQHEERRHAEAHDRDHLPRTELRSDHAAREAADQQRNPQQGSDDLRSVCGEHAGINVKAGQPAIMEASTAS